MAGVCEICNSTLAEKYFFGFELKFYRTVQTWVF